jgi:hypothetical protein
MSSLFAGYSSRLYADPCAYNKRLTESTAPYAYTMYDGKYEQCNVCVYDTYTRPFDGNVVDVESDLTNRSRPASSCPSRKYNPYCKKSAQCISTYDASAPRQIVPEICPITYNNLVWKGGNGIRNPAPVGCTGFRTMNGRLLG